MRVGDDRGVDLSVTVEIEFLEQKRNAVVRIQIIEPTANLTAGGERSELERWMRVYCPDPQATVPGLPDAVLRKMAVPALVFRSGKSDPYHTRATSELLHRLIPGAQLVEPPWGDTEWIDRSDAARAGTGGLFERWPLLAPQLLEFARG